MKKMNEIQCPLNFVQRVKIKSYLCHDNYFSFSKENRNLAKK